MIAASETVDRMNGFTRRICPSSPGTVIIFRADWWLKHAQKGTVIASRAGDSPDPVTLMQHSESAMSGGGLCVAAASRRPLTNDKGVFSLVVAADRGRKRDHPSGRSLPSRSAP